MSQLAAEAGTSAPREALSETLNKEPRAAQATSAASEARRAARHDHSVLRLHRQPKMIGPYMLQQTLGSGSFGKVKRA